MSIFAWYDFQRLYEEINGTTLEVEYVSSYAELDASKSYFVMGNTLAEQAGLNYDGLTSDTGYKIVKSDQNVFLYGKTGYGTLNAAYALLKAFSNLEFYSAEVYTYRDGSTFRYEDLKNQTFNPSVDYNWAHDGSLYINNGGAINYVAQSRLGFVNYWQISLSNMHNFTSVVTNTAWQRTETSTDSKASFTTLDLNAAGTIDENNEMVKVVAAYISNATSGNNKTLYYFGQPDNRGWSTSDASAENLERYGANSGEYVLFMNALAKCLDTQYTLSRNIEVVLLAYNATLVAPTKNLGELAFYQGDKVKVSVMFAPIEMNLNSAPTEETAQDPIYKQTAAAYYAEYAKWQALAGENNVYFWRYSTIFSNYFIPVNVIENMQASYQQIVGEDGYIKHSQDQGSTTDDVGTNFAALKTYLKGKLGRDVSLADTTMQVLIKQFCKAYYGEEAGEYMVDLLNAEQAMLNAASQTHVDALFSDIDYSASFAYYSQMTNKKYWGNDNGATLKSWYTGYIQAAIDAINANGEYTTEEKQAYIDRINVEGLAVRYMLYEVYSNTTYGTLAQIIADAKALGIDYYKEGGGIDNLA